MTEYIPSSGIDRITAPPARAVSAGFGGVRTIATILGFAFAAVLRLMLVFHYRIDSDETQHLHVVWGWSHGLLPYRDFFDNHMPLFHILSVPLLRLAGERPEALHLVRLAMLPMFALMVFLTFRITESVYSRRAAYWAATIGCLAPQFFLASIEFRTDILWATSWLAAVAILVTAPLTPRRAALAGLALGIAAATSAKTSLLAASLALAAVLTLVIMRQRFTSYIKCAVTFAAAACVPVVAIAAYFFARGAWSEFVYCIFTHNVVASDHPARLLFLLPSIAIIVSVTRLIARTKASDDVRRRRIFLFLVAAIYGTSLISFWPIMEIEHWLPFFPVVAAAMVPLVVPEQRRAFQQGILITLVVLELFWIIRVSVPWRDRTISSRTMVQQAMLLTTPEEAVIDLKGELVFRRRAFYPVLEKLTKRAIARGRLQDTIAADVLRTHAMVSVRDNPSFPRGGAAFLSRNFVDVGWLRVAGKVVSGGTFDLEIPGPYAVVSAAGPFRGQLDGTLYEGPRFLAAGTHTIEAGQRTAVVWQRAVALGFSPFDATSAASARRCK